MSFIKSTLLLAVGVIGGIAIKSIYDIEKDQMAEDYAKQQDHEIIKLLSRNYRLKIEYALVRLTRECVMDQANKASLWEEGIREVIYDTCLPDLEKSNYSPWIKEEVKKELDQMFEDFKVCKL